MSQGPEGVLTIGNLHLTHPFVLAPMAGVTDLPFRLISRRFGCELAFIEMTSARALLYRNVKTARMLKTSPEDRPLGIQLLGNDPEYILRALDIIAKYGYDVIDLNAACPVRKVTENAEGASLLREPRRLQKILRAMVENSTAPVTVKIRSGWDETSINARDVALHAQDAGISALFIHGRTRAQQYSGTVNYRVIAEVKEALEIPVVASGDVLSPELAKRMFVETGCDGVLMARGALGNPWIFNETTEFMKSGTLPPRPGMDEISGTMKQHLRLCVEFHGPQTGVKLFRKLFIWYTRGLPGIKPLREKAMHAGTEEALVGVMDEAGAAASHGHTAGNLR